MTKLLTYGLIAGGIWYFFLRSKQGKMDLKTPKSQTSPSDIEAEYGAQRYIWTWKKEDVTDPMGRKKQTYVCLDTHTQKHVDADICQKYHPGVFR